jgi:hypothetical protein
MGLESAAQMAPAWPPSPNSLCLSELYNCDARFYFPACSSICLIAHAAAGSISLYVNGAIWRFALAPSTDNTHGHVHYACTHFSALKLVYPLKHIVAQFKI